MDDEYIDAHRLCGLLTKLQTYIFFFPLAEVYFEGWHRELLVHPPLVVHRFRNHGRILWTVPTHSRNKQTKKLVSMHQKQKNCQV